MTAFAKLDVDNLKKAADTAVTNLDTAAKKDNTSAGLLANAKKSTANGKRDCDATDASITAKEAEIRRLTNNKTVATHMHELAHDKHASLKSIRD